MEKIKKTFWMAGLNDRQKILIEKLNEIIDYINNLNIGRFQVDTSDSEDYSYDPTDIPWVDKPE